METLIFNILMGECPRCGDRMEFTAGRCARSSHQPEPTNLQELGTNLTDWITKNKNEIKTALEQKREMKAKEQTMSWREYFENPEFEQEIRAAEYQVIKFARELSNLIPVLGRIDTNFDGNSDYNHLIHILEQLCGGS